MYAVDRSGGHAGSGHPERRLDHRLAGPVERLPEPRPTLEGRGDAARDVGLAVLSDRRIDRDVGPDTRGVLLPLQAPVVGRPRGSDGGGLQPRSQLQRNVAVRDIGRHRRVLRSERRAPGFGAQGVEAVGVLADLDGWRDVADLDLSRRPHVGAGHRRRDGRCARRRVQTGRQVARTVAVGVNECVTRRGRDRDVRTDAVGEAENLRRAVGDLQRHCRPGDRRGRGSLRCRCTRDTVHPGSRTDRGGDTPGGTRERRHRPHAVVLAVRHHDRRRRRTGDASRPSSRKGCEGRSGRVCGDHDVVATRCTCRESRGRGTRRPVRNPGCHGSTSRSGEDQVEEPLTVRAVIVYSPAPLKKRSPVSGCEP